LTCSIIIDGDHLKLILNGKFNLGVLACHYMYIASVTVLDKVQLNIPSMPVIFCKKCGETNYLDPKSYWTINDAAVKCKNCGTINTITLENGELKKQD
jgi:RNase P subunit RPR2